MASTDPPRPVSGYPAPPPPNASTAYAYTANHQSYPYHPQVNYAYDPYAARRATCLRRVFAIIIAGFIIFGTVTFIVWLVLRPQFPQLRVEDLRISNFTLDSNSFMVSLNSQVNLTVRNPNKKMTLKYDAFDAYLFYESTSIAQTVIPPIAQETGNVTSLGAAFAAVGTYVGKDMVNGINGEKAKNGNASKFNLRLIGWIRFEAKAWRTRRRFMRAYCGNLNVSFAEDGGKSGKLTGGARICQVGI